MSSSRNPKPRAFDGPPAPPAPVYQPSDLELDALAFTLVLHFECRQSFLDLLQQNIARFRPVDSVEFGLVEEITACNWRIRRGWAIETALLNAQTSRQPTPKDAGQRIFTLAAAAEICASHASTSVLHRQEARLHTMFQRALRTLVLLRKEFPPQPQPPVAPSPVEPSPLILLPPVATPGAPPEP